MFETTINRLSAIALVACSLGLASQTASAVVDLNTSSPRYLGYYTPPEPASPSDEAGYINGLVALVPGTTNTSGTPDYFRSSNDLCYPTCPTASATGAVKDDTNPSNTIDLGSAVWEYLIGKYNGPNGGALVWYIGGLTGEVEIPSEWGPDKKQLGLSHWTVFNPSQTEPPEPPTSIPEPASLALLGIGLVGFGMARRRAAR